MTEGSGLKSDSVGDMEKDDPAQGCLVWLAMVLPLIALMLLVPQCFGGADTSGQPKQFGPRGVTN